MTSAIAMGIVQVKIKIPELTRALEEFATNRVRSFETLANDIRHSVSNTLNQLLNAEMTLFLGRADQRENKRNGYEYREYALKGIGCVRLLMPVDRKRKFASVIVPPSEQVDPRLKQDLAVLHLAGISTRTMAMISKRILGVEISKQTVSNSLELITPKALQWLERPLNEEYWGLFIDGTNFRMQRRGSTEKEPSLVVIGLNRENRMSILAIQPGQKDNAECWREVFSDLLKRGLNASAVRIGIMDGLPGLETAFKETFTNAVTGRCWVHALKNSLAKIPERLRAPFHEGAGRVMYASSENAARLAFKELKLEMGKDGQRAVHCLEKDLESLLVHYRFDQSLWRSLRSTNPVERVNKELKRRVKSMETIGERTLTVLVAFTAMRLEYGWRKFPVNSPQFANLKYFKNSVNVVESTVDSMLS
jgi:putative transposase